MPFTLAHPAAAVPLLRPLGRFGVLSGLIIGSLTPDVAYFLPASVSRAESHSVAGLFWFCLPAGLALYLLFHLLVKKPVLSLLPVYVSSRLSPPTVTGAVLPGHSWTAVIISLFIGAVTHIVWDSFTHHKALGGLAIPALSMDLRSVGHYHIRLYTVLQHLSTVLGLGLLARWSWQWLRHAPVHNLRLAVTFPPWARITLISMLVLIAVVPAILKAAPFFSAFNLCLALQRFVARIIFTSMPILGVELLLYGSCWHLYALLSHNTLRKSQTEGERQTNRE